MEPILSNNNIYKGPSGEPPKIRVVVRKRPLTQKEIKKCDGDILEVRGAQNLVVKELK
jgi:hypothetical protein